MIEFLNSHRPLSALCIARNPRPQTAPSMASEGETTEQPPKRTKPNTPTSTSLGEVSEPLPSLPPEIIVELLSRLPVRSLLQFRCVCKSWRSLISDPQFVKTHLTMSSKNKNLDQGRIILSSTRPHFDLSSYSLHSALCEPSANAIDLDYPSKDPHNSIWIVGCCNGLVCIAIEEDDIYIWNPATKKSKKLPNSGMRMRFGCFMIYGFGYDKLKDDYKVVGVFCVVGTGGSYGTEVKICSCRTDSWRRIPDFPSGIPLDDSGKFANGVLHWAASCSNASNYSWVIVSLNLEKETYGKVEQPNYGEGDFGLTLGVLGGCLCVLCDFQGSRADVWVMMEYGVRESWTKLVSIPYLTGYGNYLYSPPLYISKNDEVLIQFGTLVVLYNPRDGKFRFPLICNSNGCLEADTYFESLVSPCTDQLI